MLIAPAKKTSVFHYAEDAAFVMALILDLIFEAVPDFSAWVVQVLQQRLDQSFAYQWPHPFCFADHLPGSVQIPM